jgi:phosphatidylglycerophosphatase A
VKRARGRLDTVALWTASLLGAGRSPIVPGTVGTLVTVPLVVATGLYLPLWGYAIVTVIVIAVAIWSADIAARALAVKDPGFIVIDEAAGLYITMLALPITPWTVFGGFFLFRVFDILKPAPAARAERLPGGLGVVLDDLIAGVYANLALRATDLLYQRLTG